MKLGILGGTFDPIHHAHLFIAEEARARCGLDRVLFVPNAAPPHKQGMAVAAPAHRLAMARMATESNPAFACSSVELDRPGISYTLDTLRNLQLAHPDAELFFITGADTIPEIPSWHRPNDLIALCRFIALDRPGYPAVYTELGLPANLLQRIIAIPSSGLEISSSEIRRRVRQGLPIRYLTPDSVVDYIAAHRLYHPGGEREIPAPG